MSNSYPDFKNALDEVSASSAGGAPFLICYGITFFITGILAFSLDREITALIAMFQGGISLPAALWLERRMGTSRMSEDNPLKQLSGLMAFSQALAIPFLIVVYSTNPGQIPITLAGLGGVHFLMYSWLHRTKIYSILAGVLSMGSFALVIFMGSESYPYVLILIAVSYGIAAPLVRQHAKQILTAA